MEVKIAKLDKMTVACVRHVGPYEQCASAWQKLMAWAGPAGAFGPYTVMVGMCYDDPKTTPPENIRYDACITIGPDVQVTDEIEVQHIGDGEYASVTHIGPYEKLHETYGFIYDEWAAGSGRIVTDGPCIEIYKNDPETTPAEKLITEVYVPLQ